MKFDKILAISMAATMCVAFTACDDDDDDYVAASPEQGVKAYFLPENQKSITLLNEVSSFNVKLSRTESASALSVPVSFSASKEGVFSCPSAVDFAAGSSDASLTIAYDGTKLDFDEPVNITINLDEASSSIYGIASYSCTAMIPAPWVSIGMATVVDDYITGFFGVENVAWQVELEANQVTPGYYRLVNPYGAGYPYNEPGDFDVSQDYYLEIHAEDPDKVWIPTTTYGMNWGYGDFIFGSLAGYYLAKGDEESAAEYYGTLQDGIISFPVDALLIGMSDYNDGGLYTCNGAGAFKVVFPGIVLADYSVEVAYNGKYYDVDDNLYVVAEVTAMGDDVEEVRLAVAPAADANDLVAAIVSGETEDYVSLSAPGSANLLMPADAESGKYSIVAVTYAGGEAQEASSATFKYTSMSGDEPTESWTPAYAGNYTYSQCFDDVDENVVMYFSDENDIRCKLAPWGNGTDLVFIWDNDDNVYLEADQDMEFSQSPYGDFYVSDLSSDCAFAPGNTWADIIEYNFADDCTGTEQEPSYVDYETSTFYFNTAYYSSEGYIIGWGYETYEILAQASAPAKKIMAPMTSFAQPVRHSHIHWLSEPKMIKSAFRSNIKAAAKRFN